MRGAITFFGVLATACALSTPGFAADLPASPAPPGPDKPSDCSAYGPKFFSLGDTGFCGKAGYNAMGFLAKDFATSDITMVGQQLPSIAFAAGVPILYYYNRSVTDRTNSPYPGVDAQVDFMAIKQTEFGALVGFLNLRAAGQIENSNDDGLRWISNNAVNGSAWEGLVDQAWVRLGGLEIGIQPSMFGFARWGYSLTPGYASLVDTPAVSYTYRVDNVGGSNNSASVSVAVEDPTRRDMADGVLAHYSDSRPPDFVAQARWGSPNVLLHIAGALHEIRDEAAQDCCGSGSSVVWGAAGTIGGEYRVKWSDVFGPAGGDMYGRFLVQGAIARGAIGYLGVPFFATDYVADADGGIHPTTGFSAVFSYEHLWTPTFKSALTYSVFHTSETSGAELLAPNMPMWFDVKVHGSQLEAGIEDMLQPDLVVGVEATYTWTNAVGSYAGTGAAAANANFPSAAIYLRKSF